jgi:hypothetical protein
VLHLTYTGAKTSFYVPRPSYDLPRAPVPPPPSTPPRSSMASLPPVEPFHLTSPACGSRIEFSSGSQSGSWTGSRIGFGKWLENRLPGLVVPSRLISSDCACECGASSGPLLVTDIIDAVLFTGVDEGGNCQLCPNSHLPAVPHPSISVVISHPFECIAVLTYKRV